MTREELSTILENHKHWINEDCEGWENMKANLCGADLYGADLRGADLYGADLRGANLRDANLRDANLCGAELCGADLRGADLYGADLRGADLYGADLCDANLRDANLCGADLYGADLYGADLRDTNLCGADLCGADLYGADLYGADLYGADLRDTNLCGAKNLPFIPYACPDTGSFIAYKKAGGYIVELEIPEDAKRVSATTRKCRCDKARVLRILNKDRTVADITEVASDRDKDFIYRVDELVEVKDFDEDRWNECSTGIHFFINFQEAVEY